MTADRLRHYLDFNATAPMSPAVQEAFVRALELANPSSVHSEGRRARAAVETARSLVAALFFCASDDVTFTASATEAAATCLSPRWLVDGTESVLSRLAVLDTDHPCIREGSRFDARVVTRLPVGSDGVVDLAALRAWVMAGEDDEWALLALTLGNSETGVLQPLGEIREAIAGRPVLLVVDAVQVAGRMPLRFSETGADALFVSGHKFGAAKGCGAMILRNRLTRPFPLLKGGGQERGLRSGTEAVPAIASMGAAADEAVRRLRDHPGELRNLRNFFEERLVRVCPDAVVLGASADRLPNTVSFVVPGLNAETAQMSLDLAGFAVSAGSACSSGKVGRSHVLAAMTRAGLPVDPRNGAIRVSFGYETPAESLDLLVEALARLLARVGERPSQGRAA